MMKKTNKNRNLGMALGMCMGSALGSSLGNVLFDGNLAMGTAIGISIGLSLGLALGSLKDKEIEAQVKEKGYMIKTIEKNEGGKEYTVTITDKCGEDVVIIVSEGIMETEQFSVGDFVFLDEDGEIEQAFDNEDE